MHEDDADVTGGGPAQKKLFRPSKREATRRWRHAAAVVRELEVLEAAESAKLRALREALKVARSNERDAGDELGEMLDGEDPTIPGVVPEPTQPEAG